MNKLRNYQITQLTSSSIFLGNAFLMIIWLEKKPITTLNTDRE